MPDLERFKSAQRRCLEDALEEISQGCKRSHWMWFVFPQLRGLGISRIAEFYGIDGAGEAKAYLADPNLAASLRRACGALLAQNEDDPDMVFGWPDTLKLRSSMTLFDFVSPNDVFAKVLDRFYKGERDGLTLDMLGAGGKA